MMIGQKNLIKQIDWMCKSKSFPRFSIIIGENGKQEIELANYIANHLNLITVLLEDTKIDTIRQMITDSYKINTSVMYVINNADDMSIFAKNSLLKITEEPPNNAYFIMFLNDLNNTLDTIKSRATVFTMEPYSRKELIEYFDANWETSDEYKDIVMSLSATPNEVDILQTQVEPGTADKFYDYVQKVVDNIAIVSGANSFKIADKIALKDESDKYDLRMFWKACCKVFHDKAMERNTDNFLGLTQAMIRTSYVLSRLSVRGVNKQMLFDSWILSIREVL